jgi:hypothetical protein
VLHTQFRAAPPASFDRIALFIVAGGITDPTYRRSATPLRWNASKWHTHFVLNMQRRFFYGYRPAVPVV